MWALCKCLRSSFVDSLVFLCVFTWFMKGQTYWKAFPHVGQRRRAFQLLAGESPIRQRSASCCHFVIAIPFVSSSLSVLCRSAPTPRRCHRSRSELQSSLKKLAAVHKTLCWSRSLFTTSEGKITSCVWLSSFDPKFLLLLFYLEVDPITVFCICSGLRGAWVRLCLDRGLCWGLLQHVLSSVDQLRIRSCKGGGNKSHSTGYFWIRAETIRQLIVRKKKISIYSLSNVLVFFFFCDSKQNIFGFWTFGRTKPDWKLSNIVFPFIISNRCLATIPFFKDLDQVYKEAGCQIIF